MSQIAKLFSGSGGAAVETITTDGGVIVGPDAAFNINLLGGTGVDVDGNAGTNTIEVSVEGAEEGTATTVGAVTADVVTINLGVTPTTYIIEAKIAGFEAATPSGVVYNLICGVRTTGAAATITNAQDKYVSEEAALVACNANFVAVGNTLVVRILGAVGLTINWKCRTTQLGV